MPLVLHFPVSDWRLEKVPHSHDLDALTRLKIRIENVPGVQRVGTPALFWSPAMERFYWHYPVERQIGVSWNMLVPLVWVACGNFFATCTPANHVENTS